MEQDSGLIVRIRSKDGTHRIQAKPQWTIRELQQKIEEQLTIAQKNQTLSRDPGGKEPFNDLSRTLSSLQIRNGDMIFLSYTGAPIRPPKQKLRDIKRKWDLKSLMEYYDSKGLVFKQQEETHLKSLSLDYEACNQFQLYVRQFAFQQQRVGFLYGTASPSDSSVTVDFIYEPPQEGGPEHFVITASQKELDLVDSIASYLGYSRVGWVFSHSPDRDVIREGGTQEEQSKSYLLNGEETVMAARVHSEIKKSQHHDLAVTVKVTATEEGESYFEAFQITDQCLRLFENEMLSAHPTDKSKCRTKEAVMMFRAGAGRQESNEIDTTVLLKPVAVKGDYRGKLAIDFGIENRPDQPLRMETLREYLGRKKQKEMTQGNFVKVISDFHLLFFLAKEEVLDFRTDIPVLCDAVRQQKMLPECEGFKEILSAYAAPPPSMGSTRRR